MIWKWLNTIVNCQGTPTKYKMMLDDTDSQYLGVLIKKLSVELITVILEDTVSLIFIVYHSRKSHLIWWIYSNKNTYTDCLKIMYFTPSNRFPQK